MERRDWENHLAYYSPTPSPRSAVPRTPSTPTPTHSEYPTQHDKELQFAQRQLNSVQKALTAVTQKNSQLEAERFLFGSVVTPVKGQQSPLQPPQSVPLISSRLWLSVSLFAKLSVSVSQSINCCRCGCVSQIVPYKTCVSASCG